MEWRLQPRRRCGCRPRRWEPVRCQAAVATWGAWGWLRGGGAAPKSTRRWLVTMGSRMPRPRAMHGQPRPGAAGSDRRHDPEPACYGLGDDGTRVFLTRRWGPPGQRPTGRPRWPQVRQFRDRYANRGPADPVAAATGPEPRLAGGDACVNRSDGSGSEQAPILERGDVVGCAAAPRARPMVVDVPPQAEHEPVFVQRQGETQRHGDRVLG